MSAPFQPGDVVVCVDDRPSWSNTPYQAEHCRKHLRRGAIYRVVSIVVAPSGDVGLGLSGIPNCPTPFGDTGWSAFRFRKIDDEVTEDFREQLRSLKSPKPTLTPSRHSRERAA